MTPTARLETVMQASVISTGTTSTCSANAARLPNGPSGYLPMRSLDATAATTIGTNPDSHQASDERASSRSDGGPASASLGPPAVTYSLSGSLWMLTNTWTLATPAKVWRSMALARLRYSSPRTAQSRDTAAQGAAPSERSPQSKSKNGTMPTPPARRSMVHRDGGLRAWLGLPKGPSMSTCRGWPEDAAAHSDLDHSPMLFTMMWA
mmetsp:Transcript_124906/g.347779  ORF Transcript_124906/g.347779 Transcript_124906/m.347779 type:complete len:207 (+) Transcript_124906:399-1019(+)